MEDNTPYPATPASPPEDLVRHCLHRAVEAQAKNPGKRLRVRKLLEDAADLVDANGEREFPNVNASWAPTIARTLIERRPSLGKVIRTKALGKRGPNKLKVDADLQLVVAHLESRPALVRHLAAWLREQRAVKGAA